MTMLTLAQAHTILDLRTGVVLAGERVLYGNQLNTTYSEGKLPYVKQRVVQTSSAPIELGALSRSKKYGTLVFDIYYRVGTGSAARNLLIQKIDEGFRSKSLGGVVLSSVQSLGEGSALNWVIDSHLVPFYFYSI